MRRRVVIGVLLFGLAAMAFTMFYSDPNGNMNLLFGTIEDTGVRNEFAWLQTAVDDWFNTSNDIPYRIENWLDGLADMVNGIG